MAARVARPIDQPAVPVPLPVACGPARAAAALGLLGAVAGAVVVALLHVVPPSSYVNPVRRTISEYALLEHGWAFDLAVLALAGGSAAIGVALAAARLVRVASIASAALLLWCVSLAAVVAFPKHNWSVGPSVDGDIHRVASVLAFLSLPVAALALGVAWRRAPRWRRHAYATLVLGTVSLLCFAPIAGAILLEPVTGVRWWRAIPLGAVERGVAVAEVVTVLALGWWAARASGGTGPGVGPGAGRGLVRPAAMATRDVSRSVSRGVSRGVERDV